MRIEKYNATIFEKSDLILNAVYQKLGKRQMQSQKYLLAYKSIDVRYRDLPSSFELQQKVINKGLEDQPLA